MLNKNYIFIYTNKCILEQNYFLLVNKKCLKYNLLFYYKINQNQFS